MAPASSEGTAACVVCEKLRAPLSMLMGTGGFRALLARALAVAAGKVGWLKAVHVKPDGTLEGFTELQAKVAPKEFAEGGVILVGQLIGLLVAFIGEELTLRMLRDVWPKVPLQDLNEEGDRK